MFLLRCAGFAGLEFFFFDFLLGAESAAAQVPSEPLGLEGREADLDEDCDGALEEGEELPEHEEAAELERPALSSVSMGSASWSGRNREIPSPAHRLNTM